MKKGYKLCPFCGEEIKKLATKCQYCKEFLNRKDSGKVKVNKEVQINNKRDTKYGLIVKGDDGKVSFFRNTPYNHLVGGILFLLLLTWAIIKLGTESTLIENIICLILPIILLLLYFSQRKTSIEFGKDKIKLHKTKKYQAFIPKYENIQLSYNDIQSIKLKHPGTEGVILLIFLFRRATMEENHAQAFIKFAFSFVIFILPFIIWRNYYTKIVIVLKKGHKYNTISTTSVKGSPKLIKSKLPEKRVNLLSD